MSNRDRTARKARVAEAAGSTGVSATARVCVVARTATGLDLHASDGDLPLIDSVVDQAAVAQAASHVAQELRPVSPSPAAAALHGVATAGESEADRWRRLAAAHTGGVIVARATVAPSMVVPGRGAIDAPVSWVALAGGGAGAYPAAAASTLLS